MVYWHSVKLPCQFKSQLLCFQASFLLMHLGKAWEMAQVSDWVPVTHREIQVAHQTPGFFLASGSWQPFGSEPADGR